MAKKAKDEPSASGLLDRAQLKKGAEELNALGFEPEIDINADLAALQEQVKKAGKLLNKEDEISKGLAYTLKALEVEHQAKVKGGEAEPAPASEPAAAEPAAAPAESPAPVRKTKAEKPKAEGGEKKKGGNLPPPPSYKRGQSIAEALAGNKGKSVKIDAVVKEAAEIYAKKTGKAVNEKESKTVFDIVSCALVQLGQVSISEDTVTFK